MTRARPKSARKSFSLFASVAALAAGAFAVGCRDEPPPPPPPPTKVGAVPALSGDSSLDPVTRNALEQARRGNAFLDRVRDQMPSASAGPFGPPPGASASANPEQSALPSPPGE
jgi:hypothetical protein